LKRKDSGEGYSAILIIKGRALRIKDPTLLAVFRKWESRPRDRISSISFLSTSLKKLFKTTSARRSWVVPKIPKILLKAKRILPTSVYRIPV
jgi:hypothetical protein